MQGIIIPSGIISATCYFTMDQTTAYIALGSNRGDRRETINKALNMLGESGSDNITIVRVSTLIETAPLGGPAGQDNYLNAVAEILSQTSAEQLLGIMQSVEDRLGRTRPQKWASRTIDLDLILFGGRIIDKPHLKVPHPLMHQRSFVMVPLVEIAPDLIHPVLGQTMREILDSLQNPRRDKTNQI
jgi:2-amino-4-hydroxy-6-hydroxymethyldihydropteridine diphosphokinase